MKNYKNYFLLILIIFTGLFPVLYYTQAETVSITATVEGCGNDVIEGSEQCDGSVGEETCVSQGYASGTLSCNTDCTFDISGCVTATPPPSGGGGGGGSYIAPTETKVIIKGKAYPQAEITLLSDGKIEATAKAGSLANFSFDITGITSGVYTFSLWAVDKDSRRSITFSFTTNVAKNMTTTVSGIFLPPTIELSKTKLQIGEILSIYGQTAPESKIEISVESLEAIIGRTVASEAGDWEYSFDTTHLDDGSHTARAKAVSPSGLTSTFSHTLIFAVGGENVIMMMEKGDINTDERVNLVDFSILLYNWGVPKSPAADLNDDGKVNLTDFSIMLYYWTG